MPHWNCTNKQLKDIFNITSNSENRTNICMKFFDILNDIYNTKILDHELHVINCSDAPHLFNINDCKNTVAQNENIDIELEIENPSIIETSNYIRKGSVKNTLLTGLNTNRGHFNTLINFMKTIDDYETVDSLEIQGFHFKYHQVLSSRLTLFSWLIRFSNSYQILVDKRRSNFLQYFSISNGYYSIIMIGINLLTYTLLEYLYFKKALFTSINKSNNQIIEKSINELNNQSIANLNNIKNTENQNDVVNLKLYIENPNKIEEQNKINSKKLANINFFNYIKFKLGKLNKVKDDLFISLIKNISYFSLISNKKELNSMQQNSFIENFDYLSEKKNFFLIDNNFSTKTSFGGFLTIAIICTFIPMIYFLNTDYFKRENPKIRSNIVDSDLAISISKFSIDYNMTIYLDDDLYKNTIVWSNNFKYATSTDLELCKNNNFNNSGDKKFFCDEVTNDVQLAKRYVITHKCKLEKYVEYNQCPSNKYKFGFNLTYPTYKDITKLNDGLIIKSLSNEFETDVNNFPFYQVNFENIVAKENTGLIFDDYKEYNFNNVLFEEINENNVLSSVDSIEIYINSNTLNIEKYLKFKNFNEFLIESFSFLTILVDLGIILANFLSEYKYLKKLLVIYEIKTNSEEKLEIGFIDYCLDYIFLSSKKYDQDVDKLNSLVSIENLIED